MFDQYKIAVKLALLDELSVPLALIARRLQAAESAASKLQSRLASMRSFFAGGMGLIGAGATVAAPLIYAIDKAALLQKQMIAVQNATRGTTDQMTAMRAVMENVSGKTIFSTVDIAKMAKQIATGTGLGAAQVTSLLPAYAKYADVQALMKDTPYTTSIADAIRAAHGAQHYDAASLTSYLNLLNKASLFIPGSTSEIVKALAYSQGVAKQTLGTSDDDNILMIALLNRLGLSGTRGGTNLIAAMTRTMPGIFGSGLLTGKSNVALREMNMVDAAGHSKVFKDGKFDPVTWMALMADYVSRELAGHPEAIARQDIMRNFQHAYGVQGSRVAALLASPQALEQWRQMSEQFAHTGGFESMQKQFADNSVWQQFQNAKTNFQNAMMEMGITLLPTVSSGLKELNTYLGQIITWMTAHPGAVRQYARDVALFAGALVGLGVISVATSGIIGLTTVIGGLARAAKGGAGPGAPGTMGKLGTGLARLTWAGMFYEMADQIIPDKPGGIDLTSWSGLWKSLRPFSMGPNLLNSPSQSGSPYIATRGQQPINITTTLNVDGKKMATVVSKAQAKAFAAPQTGPSLFDGSLMPQPAGGGGF